MSSVAADLRGQSSQSKADMSSMYHHHMMGAAAAGGRQPHPSDMHEFLNADPMTALGLTAATNGSPVGPSGGGLGSSADPGGNLVNHQGNMSNQLHPSSLYASHPHSMNSKFHCIFIFLIITLYPSNSEWNDKLTTPSPPPPAQRGGGRPARRPSTHTESLSSSSSQHLRHGSRRRFLPNTYPPHSRPLPTGRRPS